MIPKRKILIIDNNFLLPLLCKSKLEMDGGFDVDVKISVAEAVSFLGHVKPDLILLSAAVSDDYGLSVLKILKSGPAVGVKIIVLCSGKYADEAEYLRNGASAVVDVLDGSLNALVERIKKEISR